MKKKNILLLFGIFLFLLLTATTSVHADCDDPDCRQVWGYNSCYRTEPYCYYYSATMCESKLVDLGKCNDPPLNMDCSSECYWTGCWTHACEQCWCGSGGSSSSSDWLVGRIVDDEDGDGKWRIWQPKDKSCSDSKSDSQDQLLVLNTTSGKYSKWGCNDGGKAYYTFSGDQIEDNFNTISVTPPGDEGPWYCEKWTFSYRGPVPSSVTEDADCEPDPDDNTVRCCRPDGDWCRTWGTGCTFIADIKSDDWDNHAWFYLTKTPPNTLPEGHLDGANCENFWGWAEDPDHPDDAVTVKFYANGTCSTGGSCSGTYIGEVSADKYRSDGNSGFKVEQAQELLCEAGLCDGSAHNIYAYAVDIDTDEYSALGGVPKNVGPCGSKQCGYDDYTSTDYLSVGLTDKWCTANDYLGCVYMNSGQETVNGQSKPNFWEPANCSTSDLSALTGVKKVSVDDINNYQISAQLTADDDGALYINYDVRKDASYPYSRDSGVYTYSAYARATRADSWARYYAYFSQSGYYIMNVRLKHDYGTNSHLLFYKFKFDRKHPSDSSRDYVVYPANKGDNSWEWATFDLGYVSRGYHYFSFAAGYTYGWSLNGYVSEFTFTRAVPALRQRGPGTTGWEDVTNYFQTGENIVRFVARDACSGDRYFNLDWDVKKAPRNISVTPLNICTGDSLTETFTTVYRDADGYADIENAYLLINHTLSGRATSSPEGAFYGRYRYYPPYRAYFYLRNRYDSYWRYAGMVGSTGSASNTYVELLVGSGNSGSNIEGSSGNDLNINWKLRFLDNNWTETANVYMYVEDFDGLNSGWDNMGQISIDSSEPQTPSAPTCSCVSPDIDEAQVSWNVVSDVGCAGLHSTAPYHVQVWDDGPNQTNENGSGDDKWYLNEWRSGTSVRITGITLDPGNERTLYARVRARDAMDHIGDWSNLGSLYMFECLPKATISGLAWDDTNTYNCTRDSVADDPGLQGLTVSIDGVDSTYCDGSSCEATTDSNGNYSMTGVPYYPQSYWPAGYTGTKYDFCITRPTPTYEWDKVELDGPCELDSDNCDADILVDGNVTHDFAFKNTPGSWFQASDADVHTNNTLSVPVPSIMYPGIEQYFLTDTSSTDTKGGIATARLDINPWSRISERGSGRGWSDNYYHSRGTNNEIIWPSVLDTVDADDGIVEYINGNLRIDEGNYNNYQGKIVIADGNITIDRHIGSTVEETDASDEILNAILISRGTIEVDGPYWNSLNPPDPQPGLSDPDFKNKLFKLDGGMYSKQGFNFERDMENTRIPMSQTTADPEFYFNAPDSIKEAKIYLWEETTATSSCQCTSWVNSGAVDGCGTQGCASVQKPFERTRTCTPSGCDIETETFCQYVAECDCNCGTWSSWSPYGGCGADGCASTERPIERTRSCTPAGCDTERETSCQYYSACDCNCGSWSYWSYAGWCGTNGCPSTAYSLKRTRSCTPSGCDAEVEYRCVTYSGCSSCTCGSWSSWRYAGWCGTNGCPSSYYSLRRTRTCTPSGCDTEVQYRCRYYYYCRYYY